MLNTDQNSTRDMKCLKVLLTLLAVFAISLQFVAAASPTGWIDQVGIDGVATGWAADADFTGSLEVHFYVDGLNPNTNFAGTLYASEYSADVLAQGYGNGNNRYSFHIPSQYFDGAQHTLRAYAIDRDANGQTTGNNVELQGSPKSFFVLPQCSSFTYSAWTYCGNGQQTRTLQAIHPTACRYDTSDLLLQQSCQAPLGNPCQTDDHCFTGGVCTNNICSYPISICQSFTYSNFGACVNGQQARNITSASPVSCVGGNPVTTQSCTGNNGDICQQNNQCSSNYCNPLDRCGVSPNTNPVCPSSCTAGCITGTTTCNTVTPVCPSSCANGCISGTTTCNTITPVCPLSCSNGCVPNTATCNTVTPPACPSSCSNGCISGTTTCNPTVPASTTCSSFTYSAFGGCFGGQQVRSVISSSPSGCTGGTSITVQACVDITPPSSVANLNVIPGVNSAIVSWTNPTDIDFLRVLIFLNNVNIANATTSPYTITGLQPNTSYNISVQTMDTLQNINTLPSLVTFTTMANTTIGNGTNSSVNDTVPPASVSNLRVTSITDNSIVWAWNNPTTADFQNTLLFFNGVNIFNTSSNTFTALGLGPGVNYTLTVFTRDITGNVNQTGISSTARTTSGSSGSTSGDDDGSSSSSSSRRGVSQFNGIGTASNTPPRISNNDNGPIVLTSPTDNYSTSFLESKAFRWILFALCILLALVVAAVAYNRNRKE
jgi:hypothetical protein